jgi:mannose-6-phosphate isomerase
VGNAVFLQADHAEIEVGADGLKALLAYPGPNVNPDALTERRAAGANRTPRTSPCAPLVPVFESAVLNQPETPTWPS